MKKSIKYAGIAAATLLTVAPVAAPVVSQASTEEPATNPDTKDDSTKDAGNTVDTSDLTNEQINGAVSNWQNTFVNKTFGSNSNNNGDFPTLAASTDKLFTEYNQYMSLTDFQSTALAGVLNKVSDTDSPVLTSQDAQIKISANGYSKAADFQTYANSLTKTKGSITFTYTIQYNDEDGNQQTTAAKTFTLTNSQASSDTSIAATFTTPYNVTTGSNVANAKVSTSTDFQLKNKDGDKLTSTSINMGPVYKNLADAKTNDGENGLYTKATFDADTYYQPMTITLKAGQFGKASDGTTDLKAADIINGYNNGTDDYVFTVNGGTPTAANSNYSNATGDTVTVIRQIKAGDNNSASWSQEDVKGVVTTKSNHAYYTLKNGDNATITNRALAKNSAWQTNAVRTNSVTGEKQYRVGGDEWIDANDVTFSDKATDNNTEGAYTDVTAVTGMKVNLAAPSSFIYMLYNDEGKQVTSRALSGDSNWAVDKKAVNADGVTVYRVATNEWVQAGTGVSFIAR